MTKATTDMTLAIGPVVAAMSGMAVEAIHQDCGSSSLGGLRLKWIPMRSHLDGLSGLLSVGGSSGDSTGDSSCIIRLA
jgi:hypothetical protein